MPSASETTKLVSGATKIADNLLTKDNIDAAANIAQGQVKELKDRYEKGDFSIRYLAMLGAAATIFTGAFNILGLVFTLNVVGAVTQGYALILALVALILETPQLNLPAKYMEAIFKYAAFTRFVWGRGAVYLIIGSLQFVQGGLLSWAVGGYVMLIGILFIMLGRSSAQKLNNLKDQIYSERDLRRKFNKFDSDKDGFLSVTEFGTLAGDLGVDLTRQEREGVFLALDTSGDAKLSFEEFQKWWKDFDFATNSIV